MYKTENVGRAERRKKNRVWVLEEMEENPSAYCLMMLQENAKGGRKEWLCG